MIPSKYNSQYHDKWAWSLAKDGATDEEIAEAFGIDYATLKRWKKANPSLAEAMQAGKDSVDAQVEDTLFRRAVGECYVTETTVDEETDPATGEVKYHKEKTTRKQVAPDTMAMMYWLNNRTRKSGKWKQKQEVELSGGTTNSNVARLSDDDLHALAQYAVNGGGKAQESDAETDENSEEQR